MNKKKNGTNDNTINNNKGDIEITAVKSVSVENDNGETTANATQDIKNIGQNDEMVSLSNLSVGPIN